MAQQLGTLAVLPEDLGSIPSSTKYLTTVNSGGKHRLLLVSAGTKNIRAAQTDIQACKTLVQ